MSPKKTMKTKNKSARGKSGFGDTRTVKPARDHLLAEIDHLITQLTGVGEKVKKTGRPLLNRELSASYTRIMRASLALKQWHENENFVGKDGSPRRLTQNELEKLAYLVSSSDPEIGLLIEDLMMSGLVSETKGTYRPDGRSAMVELESELALAYATVAISRLIETIAKNLDGTSEKQFERQVSEVRIRAKDFPIFLNFVKNQGEAFIDTIDDWLSKREVSTPLHGDIKVGAAAFAFSTPPEEKMASFKKEKPSSQPAKLRGP